MDWPNRLPIVQRPASCEARSFYRICRVLSIVDRFTWKVEPGSTPVLDKTHPAAYNKKQKGRRDKRFGLNELSVQSNAKKSSPWPVAVSAFYDDCHCKSADM